VAEAAHALQRPRIAVTCLHADTIEQARDLPVGHQPGQLAHESDRAVRNAWIVPASCIQPLLHLKLGMIAALPVKDRMNDCAVAAHDDLRDRGAQNALTRRRRCAGMRPGALDIGAKRYEAPPLRLAKWRRTARDQGRDVALDLDDRLQGLVPSALQLAGDEPVGWIDGIVLASGMGGLIARLLQRELQLPLRRRGLV
jgi:hypothetical protein